MSPPKKLLVALGATFAFLILAEGLASVTLSCTGRRNPDPTRNPQQKRDVINVFQFDEELGWRYRPSVHSPDHYGEGIPMTTNARGMRSLREHTDAIPEGKYRIVCVGDSFTMGWGVADDETFPHYIESSSDTLEAINMGCGAYGAQQCYLWYVRDGLAFETDVLLLCLIDEDFKRMAPGDVSAGGAPRPHVELEGDELSVRPPGSARKVVKKPNPLMKFVRETSCFKLLLSFARKGMDRKPISEAHFAPASEAMFRDLKKRSEERGQAFYIVYLPSYWELPDRSRVVNTWLRDFLKTERIGFIDLSPHFASFRPSEQQSLYLPDGHFSIHGNKAAAEGILRALRKSGEPIPE